MMPFFHFHPQNPHQSITTRAQQVNLLQGFRKSIAKTPTRRAQQESNSWQVRRHGFVLIAQVHVNRSHLPTKKPTCFPQTARLARQQTGSSLRNLLQSALAVPVDHRHGHRNRLKSVQTRAEISETHYPLRA